MVNAAEQRGYAYYAITDHAPDLVMQRMTDEKMLAQPERSARAAIIGARLTLLHGTELNIAPGRLVDWDETSCRVRPLRRLRALALRPVRTEMTSRFIAACENPHVHVIGHPPTRRLSAAGRRWTWTSPNCSWPPPAPAPRWRSTPRRSGWTCRRTTSARPRTPGWVRHRQRRPLGRRPRQHAVRHRRRSAGLAHPGGRHQHLAARQAARILSKDRTYRMRNRLRHVLTWRGG